MEMGSAAQHGNAGTISIISMQFPMLVEPLHPQRPHPGLPGAFPGFPPVCFEPNSGNKTQCFPLLPSGTNGCEGVAAEPSERCRALAISSWLLLFAELSLTVLKQKQAGLIPQVNFSWVRFVACL